MSKLLTVSHNYTKSVPLLRHTGQWTLLLQNVFLFSSCLCCFLTHFCYENYAALWAEIIWIWSFSSRKEITHWSWSGKLKLWTKSLIFSHCCSVFFLILHYYLVPALPTLTGDNPTDLSSRCIFRCIVSSEKVALERAVSTCYFEFVPFMIHNTINCSLQRLWRGWPYCSSVALLCILLTD